VKVLLAVAALILVGCATGAAAVAEPSTSIQRGVTACTKRETRTALSSFVGAFNSGDYRRLNRLFAGPSWFRWYSSSTPGVRFNPQAQQRDTLIAYFHDRHAQRDRLRLTSFRFTGNSNGFGNFIWKMERAARDFRGGAWFTTEAKGAALCEGPKVQFIVMSIGSPES